MKPKYDHFNAHLDIKWKTDLQKSVIIENMKERNWQKAEDCEEDWNFYWISVRFVKQFFHHRSGKRLTDRQLVNHFPNYSELTKKDLMVKNIKRYKKDVDKKVLILPTGREFILSSDIIPTTYILPQEYSIFIEDFCKGPTKKWIFKPASGSQGKGIQLINKVSAARNLQNTINTPSGQKSGKNISVISKYIGKYFNYKIIHYCLVKKSLICVYMCLLLLINL